MGEDNMGEGTMKVANDCAVTIHYTLTDDTGEILDSSQGAEPFEYLQGHNQIVSGLEKALLGSSVGDKKKVKVAPQDGYGEHDPNMIQRMPRDMFGEGAEIQLGMQFQAQSPEGHMMIVTVVEVIEDNIVVDANHPLAGQNLNFDVEIVAVRQATEEELN